MVQVDLPEDIWIVIRQVIEQTVTAKGRDGSKMLLSIFDAFENAGIIIPESEVTEEQSDS